jgi:hypothetical protein
MSEQKILLFERFFGGFIFLLQAAFIVAVFIGSLTYILLMMRDTYKSTGGWFYQTPRTKSFGKKVLILVLLVYLFDLIISVVRKSFLN